MNQLTLTGKVVKILGSQEYNSKTLQKVKMSYMSGNFEQELIFQTGGGKATEIAEKLKPGQEITISFNIQSKEWNDKDFTTVRVWKIEVQKKSLANSYPDEQADFHI